MAKADSKPTKLSPADVLTLTEGVEERLRYQLEVGLFADRDSEANGAIELLSAAFERLEAGNAVAANRKMLEAENLMYRVYYDRGRLWRMRTQFRPFLVIYNLVILGYLFIAGGWKVDPATVSGWRVLPVDVWGVPIAVLAFGAAGGVLRAFYGLRTKVSLGEFRPQFQLSYYLAPWLGALFGAIGYAVVRAGLWTFQGVGAEQQKPEWAMLALAALAGYSWEWITEWLSNAVSSIAKRSGPAAATGAGAGGDDAQGEPAPPPAAGTQPPPSPKIEPPSLAELPAQPPTED